MDGGLQEYTANATVIKKECCMIRLVPGPPCYVALQMPFIVVYGTGDLLKLSSAVAMQSVLSSIANGVHFSGGRIGIK